METLGKIVPKAYFLWPSLLKTALTSVPSGGNLDVRIEAFFIIEKEAHILNMCNFL